jgi:hypothetical protein
VERIVAIAGLLGSAWGVACTFEPHGGKGGSTRGPLSSGDAGDTAADDTMTEADGDGGDADPTGDGGDATAGGAGRCCEAHATPGCGDPAVETCVCAMNATCCAFEWAEDCAALAATACDGCGGAGTTGGDEDGSSTGADGGPVDPGNCCMPHPGVGCDVPTIQRCVCAADAYCCEAQWDEMCVDAVAGCGATCGGGGGSGGTGDGDGDGGGAGTDCCYAHFGSTGCEVEAIEQCVCALDSYCCQQAWDWTCVEQAHQHCDAQCLG